MGLTDESEDEQKSIDAFCTDSEADSEEPEEPQDPEEDEEEEEPEEEEEAEEEDEPEADEEEDEPEEEPEEDEPEEEEEDSDYGGSKTRTNKRTPKSHRRRRKTREDEDTEDEVPAIVRVQKPHAQRKGTVRVHQFSGKPLEYDSRIYAEK